MAKVLDFTNTNKKDLTYLLKQAIAISGMYPSFEKDKLSVLDIKELKDRIKAKINNELIAKKIISSDVFICAEYISDLLAVLIKKTPEIKCVVDILQDYLESDDPYTLQVGGDICFMVCGVFPRRSNWRLMKSKYYQEAGRILYYQFYRSAQKPIGYHMSQNFMTMCAVTYKSLKTL